MDARSVWFRETGEGRRKEQLLIETMFCVYYLGMGSAVLTTRTPKISPPFRIFSPSLVGACSVSRASFGGDLPLAGHRTVAVAGVASVGSEFLHELNP